MKQHKYNYLTHKVHGKAKIDLTLEPIYNIEDNYGVSTTGNMEIGEGYWVNAQHNSLSEHMFFTLYHRHMNGKSVSLSVDIQCDTCHELVPAWVKGAMNLIIWSMNDEKAASE